MRGRKDAPARTGALPQSPSDFPSGAPRFSAAARTIASDMAQGKFASITSSLLARKGEAAPWLEPGRMPLAWSAERTPAPVLPPIAAATRRAEPLGQTVSPQRPDAVKRCSVRLSQEDYERLGHMAVKKDITRQQLLQEMMARVLDDVARVYARDCSCIGGGSCGKACADRS
jgi:hypothetical protein